MDWPKDSACLTGNKSALEKVFKYNPSPSLVVEILQSHYYEARVFIFATDAEWERWADSLNHHDRGLILVLATRAGSQATMGYKEKQPISIDDWISAANKTISTPFETRREQILSPLAEKPQIVEKPISRGVRTVPFSRPTFEFLSSKLQIHESITRTISRSDVATFTADEVNMHEPAFVYNCRTSNAWDMDLALSQTHYPQVGLSLTVLYGCDLSTNREVLKRLRLIGEEAVHPLLVPGILAEIELARNIPIVEADIVSVETKILELDAAATPQMDSPSLDLVQKRVEKRSAWLDLAYLQNSLVNWRTQLSKMADHVDEYKTQGQQGLHSSKKGNAQLQLTTPTTLVSCSLPSTGPTLTNNTTNMYDLATEKPTLDTYALERQDSESCQVSKGLSLGDVNLEYKEASNLDKPSEVCITHPDLSLTSHHRSDAKSSELDHGGRMRSESPDCNYQSTFPQNDQEIVEKVGDKIKRRLLFLQGEFEEMIRSCSMRLDGMAMATQWSHSETNVEIASATRRDSRIMKSISLVTMIFLPGTFFATVFSMTFFDWSSDSSTGKEMRVSSYVWIYVVITAFFTAGTVAGWYYFVILRKRVKAMNIRNSVA